jgi:hypothetical protein
VVDIRNRFEVFHRDGLSASRVVCNGHHSERDIRYPDFFDESI